MRALEVYNSTGRSILDFRKGEKEQRDFDILKFALTLSKEGLHANIDHRVDKMMEAGLLDEVKSLFPYRNLNALQTVGYRELFDYFDGKTTLDFAIEQIKMNTRRFAKRQITWFKRTENVTWFDYLADRKEIINSVNNTINNKETEIE